MAFVHVGRRGSGRATRLTRSTAREARPRRRGGDLVRSGAPDMSGISRQSEKPRGIPDITPCQGRASGSPRITASQMGSVCGSLQPPPPRWRGTTRPPKCHPLANSLSNEPSTEAYDANDVSRALPGPRTRRRLRSRPEVVAAACVQRCDPVRTSAATRRGIQSCQQKSYIKCSICCRGMYHVYQ